jgi:L-amino acid N-acyltransferase YncA
VSASAVIDAAADHLPEIAAIYAEAVAAGPATFDLQAPPLGWWRGVLESVDPASGRLLLVAVDQGEAVLGYAKTGPFRPKAAYDSTCETSVYVAEGARGTGVGSTLYAELLGRLDRCGLRLAVAGVTVPNDASVKLHLAHGFHEVGTFAGVGVKFGAPWDVTWFERPLHGAILLDALRNAVADASGRLERRVRFAAALQRSEGHLSVDLHELEQHGLRPITHVGSTPERSQSPLDVDIAALATGRIQRLVAAPGAAIVAPIVERPAGRVRGALVVRPADERAFGPLEEGLLSRCAEVALGLWEPRAA